MGSTSLAGCFATSSGFYRVPPEAAAELTLGLLDLMEVEPYPLGDYVTAFREARSGV